MELDPEVEGGGGGGGGGRYMVDVRGFESHDEPNLRRDA
jgi:hypothetical protein